MRPVNHIRDRRLNLNEEQATSNLPRDYLMDTVSREQQNKCRSDGQTSRRSLRRCRFPQLLQLNLRSRTYFSGGKGDMVSHSEVAKWEVHFKTIVNELECQI